MAKAIKKKFGRRLSLFIKDKTYTLKLDKDYEVEEDTKATVAHEFIRLTLHHEDYLFDHFDQFIIYEHPFGSPNNRVLHTAEMYYDDGVVILSREQLINGFINPRKYVNVSLLMAAYCWIRIHPRLDYPSVSEFKAEDIGSAHQIELPQFMPHSVKKSSVSWPY